MTTLTTKEEELDSLAELGALQAVQNLDDVALFHLAQKRLPESLISRAFSVGFKKICSDADYEVRRRLKILHLEPSYFEVIDRKPPRVKTPKELEREKTREAKHQELFEKSKAAMFEVGLALSFYEMWKLSTGKTLGDATKDDLIAEANKAQSEASGYLRNVDFYSELARRTPPGKTVAEAVPLHEAHALRQKIYASDACAA
ncbi:MAG: hypothetical protein E6R08_09805 [Nevskiaceae bacterium]|nr:MAG: hypothetical protein E6R08_09805 [Nevskiaceae bacterium]